MRILSLEDDAAFADLVQATLENEGLSSGFERVETEAQFRGALRTEPLDLILADYSLPSFDGLTALKISRELAPDVPFLFVSGFLGEDAAIESLRAGATDYVLKANLSRLVPAVRRALSDASERRQRCAAQEALQASEERLRLLMEHSTDLVAEIGEDGRFLYASPNHAHLLGFIPEELLGRLFLTLIHPEDHENLLHALHRREDALRLMVRARHKNSSIRWIDIAGNTYSTSSGERRTVTVSRDVTERRLTELKLRQQAELLNLAQDAIVVLDLNHRVSFWNRGAEKVYGWTTEEALGRPFTTLVGMDGRHLATTWNTLLATETSQGELQHHHRNREPIVVAARWSLVRDDAGQPASLFMIGTDVTEQKQLETQYFRAQRLESVGTLASGIAHDLNNVLTPISMSIQIFRDKLKDAGDQELLKNLEATTRRGADIIRQVLTFTRGMEGPLEPVEIARIVKEIARIVGETFPRSVQVETQIPRDLWLVRGNATHLYQVLMNLCVNARDAMPDGGRLALSVSNRTLDQEASRFHAGARPGDYVVLGVADTGEGMSSDVQRRMFDPFYTTKAPGKGTGLGLATVLKIVGSHSGFITVDSAPGRGTRLDVFLPAAYPETRRHAPPPLGIPEAGQGELLLIVDDEVAICRLATRILQKAGFRCLCAGNGQEAMDLFHRHRDEIRLVVTDLMMPVMGGNLAIRAMLEHRPDLHFVAMSGLLEKEVVAGLPEDRVALLPKPFEAETLLGTIHTQLRKGLTPADAGSCTPGRGPEDSVTVLEPQPEGETTRRASTVTTKPA